MKGSASKAGSGVKLICKDSPQFDLCYALADLASPDPMLNPDIFAIPADAPWLDEARELEWSRWLAVPHLLDELDPADSVEQFLKRLSRTPAESVDARLRRALVHTAEDRLPRREKVEWLHFIGLDESSLLTSDRQPVLPRQLVQILRSFSPYFERARLQRKRQLSETMSKAQQAARTRSIPKMLGAFQLPIEFDWAGNRLRALRGGASLSLADVGIAYLVPSVFNVRRLWNTVDHTLPATLFFPVGPVSPDDLRAVQNGMPQAVDPWLACRALGDPVRAAMLRSIAARPATASDLASKFGLSKATVSHHIFQLREAGLIVEQREGRFVQLSVRLDTVNQLSDALRRDLEGGRSSATSKVRKGR